MSEIEYLEPLEEENAEENKKNEGGENVTGPTTASEDGAKQIKDGKQGAAADQKLLDLNDDGDEQDEEEPDDPKIAAKHDEENMAAMTDKIMWKMQADQRKQQNKKNGRESPNAAPGLMLDDMQIPVEVFNGVSKGI